MGSVEFDLDAELRRQEAAEIAWEMGRERRLDEAREMCDDPGWYASWLEHEELTGEFITFAAKAEWAIKELNDILAKLPLSESLAACPALKDVVKAAKRIEQEMLSRAMQDLGDEL